MLYIIGCMKKYHILLDKIVSYSTDGAKNITSVKKRFIAILKNKINHEILVYHCIIQQESHIMELLIINLIILTLNHRQLKGFLVEMESEHADLLLHIKLGWL